MTKGMNEEKIKQYLVILNRYKTYFGLGDYKITLSNKLLPGDGSYLARVEPDRYEKTLGVELYGAFLKKTPAEQKNILVHELVHARVAIFQEECEKLCGESEEMMVNDITSGVMRLEEER